MSPMWRARTAAATTTGPLVPVAELSVLHLFCRLDHSADIDTLTTVVRSARDSGTQVTTFASVGHKAHAGFLLLDSDLWAIRRLRATIEGAGLSVVGSFLSITEISEYAERLPDQAKRHRLHPALPPARSRLLEFYPMSKRRQPGDNWYALDFDERSRLMHEHGRHGRHHAGKIVQLVTASTGLDDWEWGATLFAADPTVVKDVVYELRFDEASVRFAEFGPFTVGLICEPGALALLVPPRRQL